MEQLLAAVALAHQVLKLVALQPRLEQTVEQQQQCPHCMMIKTIAHVAEMTSNNNSASVGEQGLRRGGLTRYLPALATSELLHHRHQVQHCPSGLQHRVVQG